MDLNDAFNWIPGDALFKCLEIRLKSPLLVSVLRTLFTGIKAYVKGSKHLFDTLVGCRQGCIGVSLSSLISTWTFVVRVARQEVLKERPDAGMEVEYCTLMKYRHKSTVQKPQHMGHPGSLNCYMLMRGNLYKLYRRTEDHP